MREGRVFKRGKSWAYVVDVSPVGAARKQRTKSGFLTKGRALAALHDVQESIVVGRYVAPVHMTLGQYLTELWLPAVRSSGDRAPGPRTRHTSAFTWCLASATFPCNR